MRKFALSLTLLLFWASVAFAALHFPALTGRVVDAAGILAQPTKQTLESQLAAQEQQTHTQLVVVTVASLQGETIQNYGYQLGRFWGIGGKEKSNGVLLIIAPTEHQVRIEVGYGLEGMLTDAVTSQLIQTTILPSLRNGQVEQGVTAGTQALLQLLAADKTAANPAQAGRKLAWWAVAVGVAVVVLFFGSLILFLRFMLRLAHRADSGGAAVGICSSDRTILGTQMDYQNIQPPPPPPENFTGGGGSFGGGGSDGSW